MDTPASAPAAAAPVGKPPAAAPLAPPVALGEVKDPTWWRHGTIPFIVLILAAVGFDLAWPYSSATASIGAGIGCALWPLAILLLRQDFSRPEACFLGALVLISFTALAVSGSLLNWGMAFVLPLLLVLFPREQPEPPAHVRYRSWWGYWLARRKNGAQEEKALFFSRLQAVAKHVECHAGQEGWRHWTLRVARDIPAAEKILGRPVCPKEAGPTH